MVVSRMRAYRQLQGLSLYELTRRTGIREPVLSLAERGFQRLKEEDQAKIAKALGCEIETIFDDEDEA